MAERGLRPCWQMSNNALCQVFTPLSSCGCLLGALGICVVRLGDMRNGNNDAVGSRSVLNEQCIMASCRVSIYILPCHLYTNCVQPQTWGYGVGEVG